MFSRIITPDAPHPGDRPRTPDGAPCVVHMDSAVAVGAAIRAARRSADAQTRAAIRTSLVGFATAGCPAAALVLDWFDRDGAICLGTSTEGGIDGR